MPLDIGPPPDCQDCPRLVAYRRANQALYPDWFNAPVPSFGDPNARLVIVGLAPGLRGANRTGRPFTGDYAGDLLYATLGEFGFSRGRYEARPDDGLTLQDCVIINGVRCVPPANKPTPDEATRCRRYLKGGLAAAENMRAIVALGRIAHETVLRAYGVRLALFPFAHGAEHPLTPGGPMMFDSYHCSRYNTNTGVLTPAMFRSVFAAARAWLDGQPA